MKKLLIFVSCTLLLMAAGCKKNNSQEPQTLRANMARPDWQLNENNDPTLSMTAVVKVDLFLNYGETLTKTDYTLSDKDLLAAFAGDELLGIASPQDGLFYLYISAPTQENSTQDIRLRYYSEQLSNIFVSAEQFPFVNDQLLGTPTQPYTPFFVEE